MKDINTVDLNLLTKLDYGTRKPYNGSHRTKDWKLHLPQREPSMRNIFKYSAFKSTSTKHIGSSPEARPREETKGDLKQISDGVA